jgi:hypothetical protein
MKNSWQFTVIHGQKCRGVKSRKISAGIPPPPMPLKADL